MQLHIVNRLKNVKDLKVCYNALAYYQTRCKININIQYAGKQASPREKSHILNAM